MKITIEHVENGYIITVPRDGSDTIDTFVFEAHDDRAEHSGFDAHCLRDALAFINVCLSIRGGSSAFDKNVVSVILERGDEWSLEGEQHDENI